MLYYLHGPSIEQSGSRELAPRLGGVKKKRGGGCIVALPTREPFGCLDRLNLNLVLFCLYKFS